MENEKGGGGIFGRIKNAPMLLVMMAFLGVGLIVFGGRSEGGRVQENCTLTPSYGDILEEKITALLESVSGIERARVIVTVEGGSEYRYAEIGNGYPAGYLVITDKDGEEVAVVRETYPLVKGVGVVCTGGNDPKIKKEVVTLLSTALGISAGSITVTGMS